MLLRRIIKLINYKTKCPNCRSTSIIYDYSRGDVICTNCGQVISRIIDAEPGCPECYSTEIDYDKYNEISRCMTCGCEFKAVFNVVDAEYVRKVKYLDKKRKELKKRFLASLSDKKLRKNFRLADKKIKKVINDLNLSKDIEIIAESFIMKILKRTLPEKWSINGIVVASIYLASRIKSMDLILTDIIENCKASEKELDQIIKTIIEELQLDIEPYSYLDLLQKMSQKLKISVKAQTLAITIINNLKSEGLIISRNPNEIIAAAIYISTRKTEEKITQEEIANIAGISISRLKSHSSKLNRLVLY